MSETIENVYVAEVLKDKIRLINRNYETLKEIERKSTTTPLIFNGVCVCQEWENWREADSVGYWFCLGTDEKRATAKIVGNQVILSSKGCEKE